MICWLADCAKDGRTIPREEWLERMGEPTRYFDTFESPRSTEKALRILCMRMERDELPSGDMRGILMRRDTQEFLQELTHLGKGPERK